MRKPKNLSASDTKASRDRLSQMAAVAGRFQSFRPAVDVLTKVRAVPTIFPQIDLATRVGGWPIERFGLVHGPSNEGKTLFLIGLGLSFLMGGHFFNFVDAEFTTPSTWLDLYMGRQYVAHPGFSALRPRTYEQTVDAVRSSAEAIGDAKAHGELDPDVSCLYVVDSLRKLVPKNLLAKIMKESAEAAPKKGKGGRGGGARGVDGLGGRAAQHKAALNAQWLDELVPLLAQTGTAMVVVARESEVADAQPWEDDFKVGGGKAIYYDSSLAARIKRASFITDSNKRVLGERHEVTIRKTKVGKKGDVKRPVAHFSTSNGLLVPEGFDSQRDVIEQALDYEVAELAGSRIKWRGKQLGNGFDQATKKLHNDPELYAEFLAEVRAKSEAEWDASGKVEITE
jgi:hypothetical protein